MKVPAALRSVANDQLRREAADTKQPVVMDYEPSALRTTSIREDHREVPEGCKQGSRDCKRHRKPTHGTLLPIFGVLPKPQAVA